MKDSELQIAHISIYGRIMGKIKIKDNVNVLSYLRWIKKAPVFHSRK